MDLYKEINSLLLNNEIDIIKDNSTKIDLLCNDKNVTYVNFNKETYIIYQIDYGFSDDTIIFSKNLLYKYFDVNIDFNTLTFKDIIEINLKIKEEVFKSNNLLNFFILQIFIKAAITYIVRKNRFNILPDENYSSINNIYDIINVEKENLKKDINKYIFNNFRNLITIFYQKIIRLNNDENKGILPERDSIYKFINKIKTMKNISDLDYYNIELENKCLILLCQAFCNFNINAIIIVKNIYKNMGVDYIIEQIPLKNDEKCRKQIIQSIENIINVCSAKIMMYENLMK